MSIKDPSRKMSKSLGDEHCIYINDDEETIRKKISKAPTTPEGIENLKVIGGLFCYSDYDSSKNADSKEKLVQAIISYQYKIY